MARDGFINQQSFNQGVIWALARLVEMYDQPSMAADILREAQITPAEIKRCAEYDVAFLRNETPDLPKGKP